MTETGAQRDLSTAADRAEEARAEPGPPSTERDGEDGRAKLLEYLPGILAVLTTFLASVGGLTGGIARMMRNSPVVSLVVLGLGVVAVLTALLGQFWRSRALLSNSLVALSIVLSSLSFGLGSYLAVDTASKEDRPGLAAKLTKDAGGSWLLEGTAGASGLAASESLQVFVYAIPVEGTREKLFFVTAGPNSEGVASQAFSVPLPVGRAYRSFVVTASSGDKPRWCDGTVVEVTAGLNVKDSETVDGENACVAVRPPPAATGTD